MHLSLPKAKTVWPSGVRRWLKAPVRKGVGSNPTAVISLIAACGRPRPLYAFLVVDKQMVLLGLEPRSFGSDGKRLIH